MKTAIVVSLLLAFSNNAFAELMPLPKTSKYKLVPNDTSWKVIGDNFAQTDPKGYSGGENAIFRYQVVMGVFSDYEIPIIGQKFVPALNCQSATNPEPVKPMVINGVKVKMEGMCLGEGEHFTYPKTVEGQRYVFEQFKKSKEVIWNGRTYNALGFSNTYRNLRSNLEGI